MIKIVVEDIIFDKCPNLKMGCIAANVHVRPSGSIQLAEVQKNLEQIQQKYSLEMITGIPMIHSTREAYKAFGKKPGRYRPSAEALLRRVIMGKGLYHVNNTVDWLNLCSIKSGYSIGGYDIDRIEGEIRLGIGKEGEPYQAIGRGILNIHNLPLFRDDKGAFGSPTSDSERTMITQSTKRLLMVFFNFGGYLDFMQVLEEAKQGLKKYASGEEVNLKIVSEPH